MVPCMNNAKTLRFVVWDEVDHRQIVEIRELEFPTDPVKRKRKFNKVIWELMDLPYTHLVTVEVIEDRSGAG